MASRKETPDVLGSLLGATSEDTAKEEKQNTSKTEYHNTGIPESQNTIKTVKQQTRKPARQKASTPPERKEEAPGQKVKATYYISEEAVEKLEDGWIQLRKLLPKEKRTSVSKSSIVEIALEMALADLEKKKKSSLLAKKLTKK
jgi:hypothetical protein